MSYMLSLMLLVPFLELLNKISLQIVCLTQERKIIIFNNLMFFLVRIIICNARYVLTLPLVRSSINQAE